ncbi:MAG: M23 family metallopeptidase [Clostridia bacterium]|nr:M23 family metallopeptidase [Clostridia bacterium]
MKVNRAAFITVVVLLVALTVIISVTVATNRAKKKGDDLPEDTAKTTQSTTEKNEPDEAPSTTAPTHKPSSGNSGSAQVEDKLPSFILPVNGALSKKHDASLQVYSTTMKDYRVHLGVDLITEADAPVYAAADGKISKIWEDTLMGYCIAVKHSGDCYTIYKNLSETLPEGIAEGTSVRAGQLIGSVGESSMIEVAEEPHLHFEMTVADLAVDPLEYFDEKALESLSLDASYGE